MKSVGKNEDTRELQQEKGAEGTGERMALIDLHATPKGHF